MTEINPKTPMEELTIGGNIYTVQEMQENLKQETGEA